MAGVKRKQGTASKSERSAARKRQKTSNQEASSPQHQTQESEYLLKTILGETKTHYLVDWEDDPVTGEKFDPTWEPHAFVNKNAVRDWEAQKAKRKKEGQRKSVPARLGSQSSPAKRKDTPPKRRRGRSSRVIHSSPNDVRTPAASATSVPRSTAGLLEIGASQQSPFIIEDPDEVPSVDDDPEESLFLPRDDPVPLSQPPKVTVQPSNPPSSYLDYESFHSSQVISGTAEGDKSALESSQFQPDPVDTSNTTEGTTDISDIETSPSQPVRSVPVNFGDPSTLVVPDSQSLPDSESFAPSQPQGESQSTGQSNDDSQPTGVTQSTEGIDDSSIEQSDAASEPTSATAGLAQTQVEDAAPALGNQPLLQRPEQTSQPAPIETEQDPSVEEPVASDALQEPASLGIGTQTPADKVAAETRVGSSTRSPATHTASEEEPQSQQQPVPLHQLESSTEVPYTQEHTALPELKQSSALDRQQDSSAIDIASQPAVIAVSSGFTQAAPDLGFWSQVDDQIAHDLGTPVQDPERIQPLSAGVDQSATSIGFQTQIAPAQSYPVNTPIRPNSLSTSQPIPETSHPLRNIPGCTPKANTVPVDDQSTLLPTSSPFPSIPAHHLPAFGESAPAPPTLPSSPIRQSSSRAGTPQPRAMNSSASAPGTGLAERLAEMRSQKRAERAARADRGRGSTPSTSSVHATPTKHITIKPTAVPPRLNAELAAEAPARLASQDLPREIARSPSAVPAVEPVQAVTREEMNTSERYGTLLPQEQQNGNTLRRQSSIASKPTSTPVDSIHVVPIALVGHQRDAYPSMIRKHEDLIRRFLNASESSAALTVEIESLLDSLRALALHPDLDNTETYTQYDVEPSISAQWDTDASAKFRFLSQFIDQLRDRELSIAVVGKPGRLLEILVTFFAGIKVTCRRVDTGSGTQQEGSKLTVYVVSSLVDVSLDSLSADIIIGLDKSAQEGSAMKLLQDKASGRPIKMILVAPGTIEHAERCLSPQLSEQQKLRALVKNIYQLRHNAGKLEEGQMLSAETAKEIADFVINAKEDPEWPLATLSMLEDLDSQTDSEMEPTSEISTYTGEKRPLEDSNPESPTTSLAKRPRIGDSNNGIQIPELPTTINPMDIELTHISDSIAHPSLSDPPELISAPMTETEHRLQNLLHTAQADLNEHVQVLSKLQYDFEDQRIALINMTRERDAAVTAALAAQTRMSAQATTLSTLRAERTEMQSLVRTAQEALLNHSVPERAQLEQLRLALTAAEAENKSLEARRAKQEADADYARSLYQTSSTSAQKLAAENADLTSSLAVAEHRAAGEQARARQMTLDHQSRLLQRENTLLKARLRDREAALKVKDEEVARLREATRGRMGTRGASVPRSPRMASPMKFAGGAGSRAVSPAGEGRGRGGGAGGGHPLRQG